MIGRCAASMAFDADKIAPLELTASAADFSYALRLDADRPLVLQGDDGFSRKSDRGQASYYYSQPFFKATGTHRHRRKARRCHRACLDGPRMEQPAAGRRPDRMGLVLAASRRRRKADALPHAPEGRPQQFVRQFDLARRPLRRDRHRRQQHDADELYRHRRPQNADRLACRYPRACLNIETVPINPKCWMGTSFAYWEGPITFAGSHKGVGYLELTGY